MNPSILCSKLRHAFDDLQNLTTQELVDCKWSVVQRIFILLFSKSRNLCEQHENLVDLMEYRNIELQSRRTSTDKRESWTEKNNIFKTDFMRIIIDGLVLLRWPPSCIAFSDPLETLLADPRDAFVFILQFGIAVENNRQTRIKRNEESYDSNILSTPRNDRQRQQKEVTPRSSDRNLSYDNKLSLSGGEGSYGEYDTNLASEGLADDGRDRGLDIDITINRNRNQKEVGREKESTFSPSATQFQSQQEKENRQQQRTPRQNITEKDRKNEFMKRESLPTQKDFKKLSLSLEIMQHQNEMLSRQLNRMQETVCARDNAEAHMGALLNEMKVSVDDIVNMTSGRGSRERLEDRIPEKANGSKLFTGSGISSGSEAGVLTAQLNLEFLEEVRKEAKEKDDEKRDKDGSKNLYGRGKSTIDGKRNIEEPFSSKSKTTSVIPCKSTVTWSKVQAQFTGIVKQWEHARKEARSCIFQSTDLHPSSSHYLLSKVNKDSHGSGFNEPLVGRGWSSDNNIVYNDAQLTQGNIDHKGDNGRQQIETKSHNRMNYRIRLHQVLGVRPPISLIREDENNNQSGSDELNHGLDMSRVHLLQRDLIDFSEAAYQLINGDTDQEGQTINGNGLNNHIQKDDTPLSIRTSILSSYTDPHPTNYKEAQKNIVLTDLCEKSRDLLLHLSCLAPLAPLAVNPIYSSSLTGIEILEKEIALAFNHFGKSSGVGSARHRVQGALDRSRTEQMTLVRCLQNSQSMLKQWPNAAIKIIPIINQLGKDGRESYTRSISEVSQLSDSLSKISVALEMAEGARIEKGVGDGSIGIHKSKMSTSSNLKEKLMTAPAAPAVNAGGGFNPPRPGASNSSHIANAATGTLSLDSLARGVFGAEMATLVNTLRLHSGNLKAVCQTLGELKQDLLLNSKNELKLFESAKKKVLYATTMTLNSLKEMDISLHAVTDISSVENQGRRTREKKHVSCKIVSEKKRNISESVPFSQSNDFNF